MQENICRFIPFHKDLHSIHTVNFVLETTVKTDTRLKSESVYKVYYVCSGNGIIHTPGKKTSLTKGDIFFTFPAYQFAIESKENFSYMYISFVGLRTNMIFENLKISNTNFIFHDAVRPMVSKRIIDETIIALETYDAVDVAIPSADTIIKLDETKQFISEIPNREFLNRGQTPQAFKYKTISEAYKVALSDPKMKTTDDCGIVKKYFWC